MSAEETAQDAPEPDGDASLEAAAPPAVATTAEVPVEALASPSEPAAAPTSADGGGVEDAVDPGLAFNLRDVPLRVGAELGRVTFPLAQAVDLGPGVVIELDCAADDPINLCINGQRFATGQLMLIDQTEWAVRIERVFPVDPAVDYTSRQGAL